jgi:hypothetical protein
MFRFSAGRLTGLALSAALLAAVSSDVLAQGHGDNVIRLRGPGPSGADLLRYGSNTWDRAVPGTRAKGMGGAGLALQTDVDGSGLNPAGFAFLARPMLTSEGRYRMGSASGSDVPGGLVAPDGTTYPIFNYDPTLTSGYTYNNLAFGMPIVFFGRRAGVGLSYRRFSDFTNGYETRFLVRSPFGEADFGAGESYGGGIDAISPTFAVALTPRIAVGAALNFMSGDITEDGNQGVTTFGQVIARGDVFLDQEVNGTSADFGARIRLTPGLSLAGVLQAGHDLKFTSGEDSFQGLPDPTAIDPPTLILERELMDHTLEVPTMYGAGLAWTTMDDRLTIAADLWARPWDEATITRNTFTTLTLFPDSTNLTNTVTQLTPGTGMFEKSAGLKDTGHLRVGAEFLLKGDGGAGVTIPLRLGWRREPMTFASIDTVAYYQVYNQIEAIAGDNTMSTDDRKAAIGAVVDRLYQESSTLLEGDDVNATTISVGSGIKVDAFSFDFAFTRTSYTVKTIFLGAFNDFTRNPAVETVVEDRTINELSFTTTLRF